MRTINAFFASLFFVAGCMTPVALSPLPYSHPANPDADAGFMSAPSSALETPAEPSPNDEDEQSTGGMKCGSSMKGMQHGRVKHGN